MSILDISGDGSVEDKVRMRYFKRSPKLDNKYYLLFGCEGEEVLFYSKGIAWHDNEETRIPRAVNGYETAQFYRSKNKELLVIESKQEFKMWYAQWKCLALVEKNVWNKFSS